MNDMQCGCCHGCKRRCSACNPRCKYGIKYFSELPAKKKPKKLNKYAEKGGLARQLIKTSKALKKQLKEKKRSEAEIFSAFSPQDRETFSALLAILKKQLD